MSSHRHLAHPRPYHTRGICTHKEKRRKMEAELRTQRCQQREASPGVGAGGTEGWMGMLVLWLLSDDRLGTHCLSGQGSSVSGILPLRKWNHTA